MTRARVRGPSVTPSCPGRLTPCSSALVSNSYPGRHVHLSEVLRSQPSVPAILGPGRRISGSITGPWRLGPLPEGPQSRHHLPGDSGSGPWSRVRPAVPGYLGPCPRARGFDQVFQGTCANARGPAGSTRCPGRLQPGSEFLRGRPAVSSDLGPVPRAVRFDRLSRTTWTRVRGPTKSVSCPTPLGPGSENPRC